MALTSPRPDRSGRRRDSRSLPERDAPPAADLLLFPPEPEPRAPQPRVPAPLRVRRSPHSDRRTGSSESPRRAPSSSDAASPPAEPAGLRAARPAVRVAAGCCDLALLAGLDAAVVWLTLRLTELDVQSFDVLPWPPLVVFLGLLNAGYVVGLTAAGGQTIGKMAWGLRVADAAGRPVSVAKAVLRTVWAPVLLAAGIGVVWMFFERRGRALHDVLSGTRVLAVPPAAHEPQPERGTR